MPQPLRQDIHIYQGTTWSFDYVKRGSDGLPVDVTGYNARMSIKGTYNGVLQAYFSTYNNGFNGQVTVGTTDGKINLAMDDMQSSRLAGELNALTSIILHDADKISSAYKFIDQSQPTATYRYDLESVSPTGVVVREIEGFLIVHRQITT